MLLNDRFRYTGYVESGGTSATKAVTGELGRILREQQSVRMNAMVESAGGEGSESERMSHEERSGVALKVKGIEERSVLPDGEKGAEEVVASDDTNLYWVSGGFGEGDAKLDAP